jgi:hypothetical protein
MDSTFVPCKTKYPKPIYMTAGDKNHIKRVRNVLYYFLR